MTIQRDFGTPFSHWLRNQDGIESQSEHCSGTNLDFLWEGTRENFRYFSEYRQDWITGKGYWMLLEEKQFLSEVKGWQLVSFSRFHNAIIDPKHYRGFHIVQFSKTNPEDGAIFVDGKGAHKLELIEFLRFEKPEEWYATSFEQFKDRNIKEAIFAK